MSRLIGAEIFKIRRRPMIWILALLTAGIIGFVYFSLLLVAVTAENNPEMAGTGDFDEILSLENTVAFGYDITHQIVSIMAVILVASAVATEYAWRTIITMTTWTGDRLRVIGAKLIALGIFIAGGILLGYLAAAGSSTIAGLVRGPLSTEGIGAGFIVDILTGAARTWLGVAIYAALAAALATLSRSTAVGIAVTLAVFFLEPIGAPILDLLPGGLDRLQALLLSQNVDGLLAANGTAEGAGGQGGLPSAVQAGFMLLLYSAGLVLVTVYTFVRRDITV